MSYGEEVRTAVGAMDTSQAGEYTSFRSLIFEDSVALDTSNSNATSGGGGGGGGFAFGDAAEISTETGQARSSSTSTPTFERDVTKVDKHPAGRSRGRPPPSQPKQTAKKPRLGRGQTNQRNQGGRDHGRRDAAPQGTAEGGGGGGGGGANGFDYSDADGFDNYAHGHEEPASGHGYSPSLGQGYIPSLGQGYGGYGKAGGMQTSKLPIKLPTSSSRSRSAFAAKPLLMTKGRMR